MWRPKQQNAVGGRQRKESWHHGEEVGVPVEMEGVLGRVDRSTEGKMCVRTKYSAVEESNQIVKRKACKWEGQVHGRGKIMLG